MTVRLARTFAGRGYRDAPKTLHDCRCLNSVPFPPGTSAIDAAYRTRSNVGVFVLCVFMCVHVRERMRKCFSTVGVVQSSSDGFMSGFDRFPAGGRIEFV